ncbi:nucleobase:cation symporter-2 family protein [Pseudodesulfovibrio piezophilus]|uniref:Putative transporter n=1 Tax=Pseudodesulfovibrio piezophilus (strain DSM 21447 / JCM 15486 / C1TLV30) TaxID=1322246 RepID=M1WRP8_PSEP2|nr:nucleobase:cation symporter-2 family protein [Pseudodesulfovibrio piezophilus]CCH48417.1 putative transporter [Pseudodesulfovibrio piezophilus C1TLV30]
MSNNQQAVSEMIFKLEDRPSAAKAFFAALQHLMAIFVGIVTPAIVISGAVGFSTEVSSYLISMSLFVSGVATFIQCRKIGPIGSGILSIQGTSFTFLSLCIGIGLSVKAAGGSEGEMLASIFGTCLLASPVEMIFSRFVPLLNKIITPLVSGIVVTLIGLSLIKVGLTDVGGGAWLLAHKPESFANAQNLTLAAIVLVVIILFNRSSNKWLRMGAIVFGLVAGYVAAALLGKVDFSSVSKLELIALPIPFKFGMAISWPHLIPMALLFLVTTVESMGDLTATSMVSGEPVEGELYMKRISGGILGDGINSALAAVFNTFPNTTFSQNNGVIQMTGVASRYVGYWIAGLLVLFGIFPVIGGVFSVIPSSVLGGATLIMFGTVAAAGIRIIASSIIDRRGVLIMAISFALGLGVVFVPQVLQAFPPFFKGVFSSAITTGGLTAILLNIILPRSFHEQPAAGSMEDMV